MNHLPTTLALASAIFGLATLGTAQNLGLKLSNNATTPMYVEVPYSKTMHPATGITVEAWITYDESTLGSGWKWPTVARQGQAAGKEAWYIRVDAAQSKTRRLVFKVNTASSGFRNAGYNFAAGELKNWTHVAGTYDGRNVRIYINGALKSTVSALGPIKDAGNIADNTLRIGTGATVSNAPTIEIWNGEIDEFRVWPYARMAAEIKASMNQQLASVPGEVSTWNLNFNGADSSGKNNGKLVNMPVFAQNTVKLVNTQLSGTNSFGTPSPACNSNPLAGVSSAPNVGNQAFSLTCLRPPAAGNGLLWVGLGRLTQPINIGANIWVDTQKPGIVLNAAPAPDVARLPLPIPNDQTLVGAAVFCQFLWEDKSCNTPLSSSDGLTLQVIK